MAACDEVSMALVTRRAIDFYLQVAGGPQAAELRARAAAAIGSLGPASEPAGDNGPSSDEDRSRDPQWWLTS